MPASGPAPWALPRLRIDRDGAWFHEEAEVTHAGVLANLQGNLRVDAEGHYLQIGSARVRVEVEDTPFVIVRVEREGNGLVATLNDLSREPLALESLRFGPGGVPRSRAKGGRFEARFSRAATYQLLQHVECEKPSGPATLVLGDRRYDLPGLSAPETGER